MYFKLECAYRFKYTAVPVYSFFTIRVRTAYNYSELEFIILDIVVHYILLNLSTGNLVLFY